MLVSNGNEDFEYDSDEDKENKAAMEKFKTKKRQEKEAEVKKKVAIKNYLSGRFQFGTFEQLGIIYQCITVSVLVNIKKKLSKM